MKQILLLLTLLFSTTYLCAQSYIDHQQERIDGLDGEVNQFIAIKDLDIRNSATHAYIYLIDDLQNAILENDNIINEAKVFLYKEMNKELFKVNEDRLLKALVDEVRYTFLLDFVKAYGVQDMSKFLNNNINQSFTVLNYLAPFPEMEDFLNSLPANFVDQLLYQYNDFRKMDYAQDLLEKIITKAPVTCKKYFVRNQPIYNSMFISNNPTMAKILEINEKYRRNTKAYILLDKIMNKELTIEEADAIGESEFYFKNLLEIRAKKDPLAEVSLDREITYEALEYVREVNLLHEESDVVRFKIVKDLYAAELYTLIVYGEDEIFTSSFNGVYAELRDKMADENLSGYDLLEKVGFNKFRMFIKMLSYYGKLDTFLETMNDIEKVMVLKKFIGGIQESPDRLAQAVSVVDAISAIEDPEILKIFEDEIYIIMNITKLDDDAQLIYGLLIKMFNPKVQTNKTFFDSIASLYFTPPIEKISFSGLYGKDGKNVQKHFFYDDEDGVASFNSFLGTFRAKEGWLISEEKEYIKITSTNLLVKIYANKPKYDETAWFYVDKEMKEKQEEVEFIIHRGHSYYVDYTIEQIPKSSKLILLGSCGGYNKLSSLLERSNNAQIISTKQIGSMGVNNPLIFKMAEKVRTGNELVWKEYWDELKVYFKDASSKTKERFYDYVPPHQNLGAKFIASYKMLNWVGGNNE